MIENLKSIFDHKSIALLGFGREGRSSYALIRKLFQNKTIAVIDENDDVRNDVIFKNDQNLIFITGKGCMQQTDSFDFAIKSPGIPSNELPKVPKRVCITSQTDIFLQYYGKQVIGITGTKGKSTTSSLIFHILKKAKRKSLFVGNIGIPPFDCIDDIAPESVIVMELSSHQLEYISHSPHIAILLNIFQEHLDHYTSYKEYQLAKLNIAKFQGKDDYFIFNSDNEALKQIIRENPLNEQHILPFSLYPGTHVALKLTDNWIEMKTGIKNIKLYDTSNGQPLQGHHNLYNIMASATACYFSGVTPEIISSGIRSFKGLDHRIESVGEFNGIHWYNDSIATIPEATIEAVKTLQIVDTLILGGFDRGIDYHVLYPFLNSSEISNIIFIGEAGIRMMNELQIYGINKLNLYKVADYKQVVALASEITAKGKICLLSPAAASYDMFRNFEERGNVYKKNVRELSPSHK